MAGEGSAGRTAIHTGTRIEKRSIRGGGVVAKNAVVGDASQIVLVAHLCRNHTDGHGFVVIPQPGLAAASRPDSSLEVGQSTITRGHTSPGQCAAWVKFAASECWNHRVAVHICQESGRASDGEVPGDGGVGVESNTRY